MLEREAARQIAERALDPRCAIDDSRVIELDQGWYFPSRSLVGPMAGSHGVIVNKKTGKILTLGSAFAPQRDLDMYERGYHFERDDLVVLKVANLDAALTTLLELGISATEPAYEHGTVWRIPRRLTRDELAQRLRRLPFVFGDIQLYFRLEVLEKARSLGSFQFEALEFPRAKS